MVCIVVIRLTHNQEVHYTADNLRPTNVTIRVVTQKYGYGIVDRSDTCDSLGKIYLRS